MKFLMMSQYKIGKMYDYNNGYCNAVKFCLIYRIYKINNIHAF